MGPRSSLLALLGVCTCTRGPAEPRSPVVFAPSTVAARSCPPLAPPGPGYAPWETWQRRDRCVRGPRGRWTVTRDPTDGDGWRHFLRFEPTDGRGWRRTVISPTGLAVRGDGSLVLMDLQDHVNLISPAGAIVARTRHPDCGAVERVAVAWDDTFAVTCGYSLLRFDRDGKLLWQKWPFGNTHINGPWVDRGGTLYVSGGGRVAALAPDGSPRWEVATGWNRHVGDIGWLPDGHMVFVTTQDEAHTPTSPEGGRVYYPHEPPELFEVTRGGTIVRRVLRRGGDPPPGAWPPVVPAGEDGAHRIAEP